MRKVRKTRTFGSKTSRRRNAFGFTKFEIAKLELQPGDMIVLRTDLLLNKEQLSSIREAAQQQFPGIKVVVLTAGISLAVLSDKRAA
jgi:serine phosphatase RsbU (regulator of sigma subunit)